MGPDFHLTSNSLDTKNIIISSQKNRTASGIHLQYGIFVFCSAKHQQSV